MRIHTYAHRHTHMHTHIYKIIKKEQKESIWGTKIADEGGRKDVGPREGRGRVLCSAVFQTWHDQSIFMSSQQL